MGIEIDFRRGADRRDEDFDDDYEHVSSSEAAASSVSPLSDQMPSSPSIECMSPMPPRGRKPSQVHRSTYKNRLSFNERQAVSVAALQRHPDRVPVLCETARDFGTLAEQDTAFMKKYLVPGTTTFGQFLSMVRKCMHLSASVALFVLVEDPVTQSSVAPSFQDSMSQIYAAYKDPDGLLYMSVRGESTFG